MEVSVPPPQNIYSVSKGKLWLSSVHLLSLLSLESRERNYDIKNYMFLPLAQRLSNLSLDNVLARKQSSWCDESRADLYN